MIASLGSLGSLGPRLWPLALGASFLPECEAPCKGPELGRIEPQAVGDPASVELELPPDTTVEFYQDLRLEIPEFTVTTTKIGPDGKEILEPGQKPKPPPYPGKITRLNECYRWEIDVMQAGTKTHLSCDPIARGGQCGSTTKTGRVEDKRDCLVDDCELALPSGGPTTVEASFDIRYDCDYQVINHVLKVVQVE